MKKVAEILEKAIEDRLIPGAVISVTDEESTIYQKAFGYAHDANKLSMTKSTIFDLASLTKVVATLPAVLQLLDQGQLDLDDSVSHYLPQFEENHPDLTLKHFLTHTSGLQPEIRFWQQNLSVDEAIDLIAQMKEKKPVGTEVIYSDLNFITLGKIVEKITNMPLDVYTKKFIYEPLEMKDTVFNPAPDIQNRIAATEYRETLNDYQWGTVHDENALHFGGVSGHAGLFSTAEDLSKFARMILNDGHYNGQQIISKPSLTLSRKSQTKELNQNRGIGWQLYDPGTFSGQFLSDGIGHTGFTGTSMWISKENQYAIILLTNRVHFGRDRNIHRLRKLVHNCLAIGMS
ncbi:MAG TPA: serine hydrolase domain-containing protein [Ureibacillus sp.]|nr:serine hydrolase domain-containing protein [Ureibacillus sp.]